MTEAIDPREDARKGILPWPKGSKEFMRIASYVNGYPRPMLDATLWTLSCLEGKKSKTPDEVDEILALRIKAARDRATEEYLTGMHTHASVKATETKEDSLTDADMILRDLASHDKGVLEEVLGYTLSDAQIASLRSHVGVELVDPNPVIRVTFTARVETSGISDFAAWKQGVEDDEEKLVGELFSPFGSCYDIEVADLYVGDEV